MIRVNLISEAIPLAHGEPLRLGAKAQALLLAACLAGAVGWLVLDYYRTETAVAQVERQLVLQRAALAQLNRLQTEVTTFEREKAAIDRRIQLITQLESNRADSQQLLASIAGTVDRTPLLWLTRVSCKGDSLSIEGEAGSISAVAAFISALRFSGHFGQIQMKTTQQQPNSQVPSFNFSLSAEYQPAPAATAAMAGNPSE